MSTHPPPAPLPAQGEARLLRDETHRLALELRERQLSLDKLRAKYETLVAKARTPDGGWVPVGVGEQG